MSGIQPVTNDDKLWAGLSYVGLAIFMIPTVAIFFLKRGESEYIKFHALQALIFGLASFILNIVIMFLASIPMLGIIIGAVGFFIGLALMGYWIYLLVCAFMGKDFEIPVLGALVRQNWM